MLKDPRAKALADNFAAQWLQLRLLDNVSPDAAKYPAWNDGLRAAMRTETSLFFQTVVSEDRSVLELLDADWTYVNEPLARHYGMEGVEGDKFRRVALPKNSPRGGVLTQASVLTVTSNPARTSPVKRGKWVLDNLLGTPPPPAPPNVPELDDEKKGALTGTLRERLEEHRKNPACASLPRAHGPDRLWPGKLRRGRRVAHDRRRGEGGRLGPTRQRQEVRRPEPTQGDSAGPKAAVRARLQRAPAYLRPGPRRRIVR
jgi:hypothetical protein